MNTKHVLKWNHALRLLFNIQSSDYGADNKPIHSLYEVHCKFLLGLEVETGHVAIAVKQTS